MKNALIALIPFFVCVVVGLVVWEAYNNSTAANATVATKDVSQVRVFMDRDGHGWEMAEDKNGQAIGTGKGCDSLMIVDPVIKGERVYPREKNVEPGHFFYLDQLVEVKCIVFRVKPGAKVFSVKADHADTAGADKPKEEKTWSDGEFIVVSPKDLLGQEVFVSPYGLDQDKSWKFFLWRTDLELVSYRP